MRIVFIRHGRTQSNVHHLLDTAFPGAELDEVGLAQAAGLPESVVDEPIEVVLTSDITRARQTAEPLARSRGVPLLLRPGLREIAAGEWEMSDDWVGYIGVLTSWATDLSVRMPGGEDGFSFFDRFDAAIAEAATYDCAAVVSHGGALRTWLVARGGVAIPDDWILRNTDTAVVEGTPGDWRLLRWGYHTL